MENVANTETNKALANIANQMALSLDAITAAKKDWFPAALALLPVIYKPELLKKLGYNQGATAYFKDQSNALGLKQTTLANIKNTFQKVITFKKHFENVDIKNANISVLTNIFNKAKAKNTNGKLTETNVKNQIKAAINEGVLKTTDINYIEDIDQQIAFTKSIKITKLDENDENFEIILNALDQGATPSSSKKAIGNNSFDTLTESQDTPAAKKELTKVDDAAEDIPKTKASSDTEKPVVAANEEATESKIETALDKPVEAQSAPITTAQPLLEQEQKEPAAKTGSAIIDHFRELNMADKELIASVAAAMVGDKTEALLLSLPANKQALIIEMIKRFK